MEYVNNEELVEEILKYKEEYEKNDDPNNRPKMSDKLGQSILLIGENYGKQSNWAGYTYLDEMISDGVENCVKYLHNFDTEKSTNAFAYITQYFYYAFIARIEREKKQQYTKLRILEKNGVHGLLQGFDRTMFEKKESEEVDVFQDADEIVDETDVEELKSEYQQRCGLSEKDVNKFDEETSKKKKKRKKRKSK